MKPAPIVLAIRDNRGGKHLARVSDSESLPTALCRLTNSVIDAGRRPVTVLTCLPGGKQ